MPQLRVSIEPIYDPLPTLIIYSEEGHMAKECDKPKNPANSTCRNCEQVGHFSKDCPEPRDWSKVKCNVCGESK